MAKFQFEIENRLRMSYGATAAAAAVIHHHHRLWAPRPVYRPTRESNWEMNRQQCVESGYVHVSDVNDDRNGSKRVATTTIFAAAKTVSHSHIPM